MSLINALISEIENEASNTKKMLERVPADKFEWRPHEKSMSLKALATHIATLSSWPGMIAKTSYLDFMEGGLTTPEIHTADDLVREVENRTRESIEALKSVQDTDLTEKWTLKSGDHIIMEMPKASFIRAMAMNHVYHHRAQLSVYLRLLDVPVPGLYGPSADDKIQATAKA